MTTGLHNQNTNSKKSCEPRPVAAAQVQVELGLDGQSGFDHHLETAFQNGQPGAHRERRHTALSLLKINLFVLLAIITLEAFFSIAGIGQGEIVKPDLQLGCKHIADKPVTWRLEGYSRDRLNSAGMRDVEHALAKPKGTKRLAFLGDSFTEGLQVPLQDTFARRMQNSLNRASSFSEGYNPSTGSKLITGNSLSTGSKLITGNSLSTGSKLITGNSLNAGSKLSTGSSSKTASGLSTGSMLRYETLNFGCSSYSTGQELVQFDQQVAAYKPDLVVLLYTPGDTLENSVSPTKRAAAEARPYFYLDHDNLLQQDNGVLALNYEKLKPRPFREFLRAHSTIFGAYNQTTLSLSMSDKVYFRVTRLIAQISSKLAALLPPPGRDKDPPAGLPASWAEPDRLAVSEAIIKKLDRNVKASGGKLVLMTFPDIGKGNPEYISARTRFAKLARKEGFGYLDLSDAFSRDTKPNNLFVKIHFSKLGHDLTARELTAYLKSAKLLPN